MVSPMDGSKLDPDASTLVQSPFAKTCGSRKLRACGFASNAASRLASAS
jgi:hypothetical protein